MPHFHCDLARHGEPLRHVWSHTIGSGHAPLALRADWQAQMRRMRTDSGVRYVRFHDILSDDMGTMLIEQDKPVYSFFNADQIIDFLLEIGMRPFVELSFMPAALRSGNSTVFSYQGNITPPKDMDAWADLIGRLVGHWCERYGVDEVRQWYFEVWNEPNLSAFWTGSQADYFQLYQHTAAAIKKVDAHLRVGGPATANDEWIADFVKFCEARDVPADFISTHHYPTDAFGKPGDDTETQLSEATRGFLRQRTQDTCRAAGDRPVIYTEWCSSSNPFFHRHDEPYAAAFLMKNLLDVADLVHGYSWWTFSDIFEENYFSSVPFHGGFGLQTIHGIAKPTYHVYQLLHGIGHERLLVDGLHHTVDASVVRGDNISVLLTNHAFPEHDIKTESVQITLHDARKPTEVWLERIDDSHCNPRAVWEKMGSPDYPDQGQMQKLQDASRLHRKPMRWKSTANGIELTLQVPAHGVAVITLEFAAAATDEGAHE